MASDRSTTHIQICEQSGDSARLSTTGVVMRRIRALLGHKAVNLLRGSAILFSGRLAGAVCVYVLQVVLARSIGGAELGNYVRAFSWCVVLANLSLLGLDSAAIRFIGTGMATGDVGRIGGFIRRSRQIVLVVSCLMVGLQRVWSYCWEITFPVSGRCWSPFFAFLSLR